MGLQHLPIQTRHNDNYYAAVFNDTWGHYAPHKNTSYPGIVRFCYTDHSEYGCQPIILQYDFNLNGPYIHDHLFENISNLVPEKLEPGAIYDVKLTFRNYRYYKSKPILIAKPASL